MSTAVAQEQRHQPALQSRYRLADWSCGHPGRSRDAGFDVARKYAEQAAG